MSLTVDGWTPALEPTAAGSMLATAAGRGSVALLWKFELAKIASQFRVWAATAICAVVPFLILAAVKVQSAVPQDTLFGQWLHQSGFALPMVVVAAAGQWVLPLLTSIVAGNIFSAEDHLGTWKTVLTRSRTRGQVFAGKALAAFTYTIAELAVLAASCLAAGAILGTQPVVGLSGQLVDPASAAGLVAASWATQLPPLLGFCALSIFLSVATRSSPVGVGGPLVIGLAMQLASFVSLPFFVQVSLLSTPFGAWHGLWVQPEFFGPLREGLVTSAVWLVLGVGAAWLVFRRRAFGAW